MSKRSASDAQDGQPFQKIAAGGSRRDMPAVDEMGEFEDAWEDDIESDEEVVVDGNDENDEDGSILAIILYVLIRPVCFRNGCGRSSPRY